MSFSQNDLVQVTREVETTAGTVDGGARDRVYSRGITWTPEGQNNQSNINTGEAEIQDQQSALRAASLSVPSSLVFGLNDAELEDVLRDTFAGSETEVLAEAVTFAQSGTHLDGSTGPTITADAGTPFSAWVGEVEGCVLEVSGAGVDAANARPRAIKAVSGGQIDLVPEWTEGGAGEFGEPLTDEAAVSADLKVGDIVKNRAIENVRSVNYEFNYTDQSGGSFRMVKGARGTGLSLGFEGKGNVDLGFSYLAMDYDALTAATQGSGVVNANAAVSNAVMNAANNLAHFVVGGNTILSAQNLISFSLEGDGTGQGIDNVAGNRFRAAVLVGDFMASGRMRIYHEHARMSVIDALAHGGNKSEVSMKFLDSAGNAYWFRLPKVLFNPGGESPGEKGSPTDGEFSFVSHTGGTAHRTFIVQKFAAP